jgi:hypothetical protein
MKPGSWLKRSLLAMKPHPALLILLSSLCASSMAHCAETVTIPAKAPPLGGFRLGQPIGDAGIRLGPKMESQPISANDPWARMLENADKSISLLVTQDQGVAQITLRSHDSEGLLGIRIGDNCELPRQAWGKPSGESSANALWNFGVWIAQVHCDASGKIDRLTIGM